MNLDTGERALVAVVIPAYQAEAHLRDAIDSALSQSISCEVIVVDDGSTDRTAEIARSYARVLLVVQSNQGAGSARSRGLANTSAPFVMFLDADDRLCPDAFLKLLEPLLSDDEVDFSFGRMRAFADEADSERFALRLNAAMPAPTASSTLIRRSFLDKMGPLDPSNHSWIYWILKARSSKAREAPVADLVSERRLREGSISTSTSSPGTALAGVIARSRAAQRKSI
jgi:glycosyltransferase involved in cell wall biosynthesis